MGFSDRLTENVQKAGQLLDIFKNSKTAKKEFKEEVFFAVGVNYYLKNIKKVMKTNLEYLSMPGMIIKNGHAGQKIFQYNYVDKPAKLIPEPGNPHDKNAVMIKVDGHLVGYIKREECTHIKNILKKYSVKYINAFITGGKYKIVSLDKSVVNMENHFIVRITIGYYK